VEVAVAAVAGGTVLDDVAGIADEYDDRLCARYGGQTALERIRDTGGRVKRRGAVVEN
jgi:hypothetical protein